MRRVGGRAAGGRVAGGRAAGGRAAGGRAIGGRAGVVGTWAEDELGVIIPDVFTDEPTV